ncbi:radical SAM protein [Magnetospirillum sp. 64-120]|uniref:radical SAM/SPASM domain-containing protein n=1 Tax=Magnetospirillum sp. 64-120 TaxID=1895778 RepID=UPI0009281678|nr:radical SAM protein [Magnetospirillum sp. 64-120]OJX70350.1 MAG: hypothetical protein BGO92_17315 [Magnetospirillum sp. 64-120]
MKRRFSAPTSVNLELTDLCNVKCRHCYNYWRDDSMGGMSMTPARLDDILERLAQAGVFHVIFTGGEPFATFDLLEHGLLTAQRLGLSVSCNSNLMLATPDRVARLAAAGLDHILTSLPSPDPAMCDRIMNHVGAFEKVMTGIGHTVQGGIRVSVNMVITRANMTQVRQAGEMLAGLGAQRLFVTRSVPPTYSAAEQLDEYVLTPDEQRTVLDDALWVRDQFGLMVGSLVSFPLCFLGDLERYGDFVGRGCPSQAGHRASIGADGTAHVCVHEEESYGNLFEQPLTEIYGGRMSQWHDGSFRYAGCAGCRYSDICESGCSMAALGHYGSHSERDPLFVGPHAFSRHIRVDDDPELLAAMDAGLRFIAPRRLRFRAENGFHLLNVRWGNAFPVEDDVAAFLVKARDSGQSFDLKQFGVERKVLLARLFVKDAVEAPDYQGGISNKARLGVSLNIDALPELVPEGRDGDR